MGFLVVYCIIAVLQQIFLLYIVTKEDYEEFPYMLPIMMFLSSILWPVFWIANYIYHKNKRRDEA